MAFRFENYNLLQINFENGLFPYVNLPLHFSVCTISHFFFFPLQGVEEYYQIPNLQLITLGVSHSQSSARGGIEGDSHCCWSRTDRKAVVLLF